MTISKRHSPQNIIFNRPDTSSSVPAGIHLVFAMNTNSSEFCQVKNRDQFSLNLLRLRQAVSTDQLASSEALDSLVCARQYHKAYQLALDYVKPGDRVLDWGAGNGHFAYFL